MLPPLVTHISAQDVPFGNRTLYWFASAMRTGVCAPLFLSVLGKKKVRARAKKERTLTLEKEMSLANHDRASIVLLHSFLYFVRRRASSELPTKPIRKFLVLHSVG